MYDWWMIIRVLGLIALWVYPPSLYYAFALVRGVGFAGQEQHRITPLSPRYFFLRAFWPHAVRIGIWIVPWYFGGSGFPWYLFTKWYTSPHSFHWSRFAEDLIRYMPIYFSVLLLAFAVANVLVLRFRWVFGLAVVSTLCGVGHLAALWGILDFADFVISWKAMSLIFGVWCLFWFGVSFLCVRFGLDRGWFDS